MHLAARLRVPLSRAAIPFLVLLAVATGCGGDDGEPAGATTTMTGDPGAGAGAGDGREPPGGAIVVSAPPTGEPAFEQEELEADAGWVRLRFRNPSESRHALCVDSEAFGALGCTGQFREDTGTLRLRLEAGSYRIFCNLPGHREAGMESRLSVE